MTHKIACAQCGRTFAATSRRAKLCSKACRAERAKAQRRAWFAEHKKAMADYWHRYHAERRAERNAANIARYHRGKRRAA